MFHEASGYCPLQVLSHRQHSLTQWKSSATSPLRRPSSVPQPCCLAIPALVVVIVHYQLIYRSQAGTFRH